VKSDFWKNKTLEQFSQTEWESLCDHCGLCCLLRLEDEDTGEFFATNVICANYNLETKSCSSYKNRQDIIPDCTQLTFKLVKKFDWLPDSCAYRLIFKNKDLPHNHPLITGKKPLKTVADYYKNSGLVKNTETIVLENFIIE
jgi:uncharacterized cysteine cluster protein YcgN (CxxCxxCC family)